MPILYVLRKEVKKKIDENCAFLGNIGEGIHCQFWLEESGKKDPSVIDISLNLYIALLNENPKTKGASNDTLLFREHKLSTLPRTASAQNHTLEMVTWNPPSNCLKTFFS